MSKTENPTGEPAHDVLAAEAFAVPAPDPSLRHGPVVLPGDPSGIAEPHDVLAAEEFPMPAARSSRAAAAFSRRAHSSRRLALIGAGALVAVVARRLLRRR
jgi:hypothetical protein